MDFGTTYDKLAGFDKPDDIADFLRGQGVKGYKGSEDQCPIAQWMQNETGESITVNGDTICRYYDIGDQEIDEVDWEWLNVTHHREPTTTILEFIQRFDNGEFPDLVMDEPEYIY